MNFSGPPLNSTMQEPAYRTELQIALEELGRTRAELRWLEQRYFVLVEALEEGIILLDDRGRVTTVNPSARVMIGDDAAINRWLWGEEPEKKTTGQHPATETLLDGLPRTGVQMQHVGPDNVQRWLTINARAVFDMDTGRVAAVLCSFSDFTIHKNLELELEKQATVDVLTGVYNRRYIERRLEEELNRAHRGSQLLALAMADLDHFKEINDRYGHTAGDRALKHFADTLALTLRAQDLVARVGGDEFCVVLPGTSVRSAGIAMDRCLALLRTNEVESDGKRFQISGTIGVAGMTTNMTATQLLDKADQALYAAKQAGRGRVVIAS